MPSDMCSPTWESHIPSDVCCPTWKTHIPSDMCSPTWEIHIPRDMCSPTWETHIPTDMCSPTKEDLFLVICVPLPNWTRFLGFGTWVYPLSGGHLSTKNMTDHKEG